MAVSILTLKTGDRVIAELKEIFDGEGDDKRGVCLLMEEPYVLNLEGGNPQYLTEEYGMEYQIKFSKWNPYSSDWQFKMPYDCIMTISNPDPGLQNAYETKIAEKIKRHGRDTAIDGTATAAEEPGTSED